MEGDLEIFLRSRGIPQETILLMKQDKIDKSVLSVMKDEQMANYLKCYGDRVAVVSFCHQTQPNTNQEAVLQRVRDKIETRKLGSTPRMLRSKSSLNPRQGSLLSRPKNHHAEKTTRKIEIGWLNFCSKGYQQVRTRNGGGTRHVSVKKSTTVEEILAMGKDLFFPNGLSTKGSAEDFNFHVCDFKRNPISLGDTVGLLYEQTKLKLLRFYICTRDTDSSNQTGSGGDIEEYSSDSDSWDVLEKEALSKNATIGEDLELQEHTSKKSKRWSPESPNETSALAIQNTNTDNATSNPKPCTGDEGDTLLWDPENEEHERTEVEDVIVINLCLDNADDVTELFMDNEEVNEPVPTTLSYEEPLLSAKSPHERVETSLQSNSEIIPGDFASESENYSNSSTTNDDLANSRAVHYVSVHRITILKDLIVAYLDPNILQCTLKMEFVNEKAIDDSGVSRDIYTAFWEQFLEQCEGEEERVPRLRPDFSEDEWQAVGRIWAKGFLDHGVLPIRLSKSFILASIHGIDAVDVHVLLSSFLNYLSSNERVIIERALQGTLEESDEEDLLDLFTRMGSQCLPPKDNMESAIQTMAHKAILQEPKYIVDCFSKAMSCVQQNLSDKKSVLSLYEMKKATGKKVSQLLQTTKEMLTQQEQATFNHLQRYVRNADQKKAEQFLRFCTGSSVMCVDKINVCFNAESGLSRRPVAHTCGATLEVSYTYSSYPEFRTEFDNILSSNYLTMDII